MILITVNISEYAWYYDMAPLINSVLNILVLCAKVRAFFGIDNTVYQGRRNYTVQSKTTINQLR